MPAWHQASSCIIHFRILLLLQALVYEAESGEVLGRASISYGLVSERPGQAEQHPQQWLEVRVGPMQRQRETPPRELPSLPAPRPRLPASRPSSRP